MILESIILSLALAILFTVLLVAISELFRKPKRTPITTDDIISCDVVKEFEKLNKALKESIKLKNDLHEESKDIRVKTKTINLQCDKCKKTFNIKVDIETYVGCEKCKCGNLVMFGW